jgi:hypothetical protein
MACGAINGLIGSGATSVNSLGFKGVAGCCRLPCPSLPLQHVRVCVLVNKNSQVQIQQGCFLGYSSETSDATCDVSYSNGIVEDSWGKKFRVVSFDRYVESGTFLQLSVCALAGVCTAGTDCGLGPLVDTKYPSANKLLKFEIDGIDIVNYLQGVLTDDEGSDKCVKVSGSCTSGQTVHPLTSLQEIPWGSVITVGPIGERTFA